ncbi:hypothetical protein FOC1_g10008028 [Fusarium oxysporum f. sp. cubense race 1]|uniref:Uncharacterized protein n=1 Tax=Fusarium oxysporum f. sp. cubense (strain race 1) TaxID=1229664 RepID=N4U505_FUSC1|nr:hypothetical protein FOC1_g10008028 [Fusarium oxysporum f. sp. cubense race 1]
MKELVQHCNGQVASNAPRWCSNNNLFNNPLPLLLSFAISLLHTTFLGHGVICPDPFEVGVFTFSVFTAHDMRLSTATATTESTSSEATATSSSSGTTFTTDEATTTKAATTSEEATSSTEDADATPTIDPNYQPLVQQDPECLEPADGDHGAIDPGTQDDYAEDFSSQEPDGGWEAGADIQHSYKETSHGVVYEYKVNWAQDCITDGDTQDIRWPLGQAGDITAYSLMRGAFEKWNNGGIGGSIQAGRLVYTFNGYDE